MSIVVIFEIGISKIVINWYYYIIKYVYRFLILFCFYQYSIT